ncbi:MAG: circadian clock protein KaiC [Actinomycetota bacterium]|nr:circadian clock protein KaiC [Actinomycetota bacterium]
MTTAPPGTGDAALDGAVRVDGVTGVAEVPGVDKLPTGIPGFDHMAMGGLPAGRTTLVSGAAGSAKTVFAAHFLAAGIALDEPGVFVTFEETPRDIARNMYGFGWDIPAWEADGTWRFVDASPDLDDPDVVVGDFEFSGLFARLEHIVRSIGATRVAVDSLGAVFTRFADSGPLRTELLRLVGALRRLGVTAVVTAERVDEDGPLTRWGIEEFVADNVIVLRNQRDAETRRRTVEILKYRGAAHTKGEFPFTVMDGRGVVVLPLATGLGHVSGEGRVTAGDPRLDDMCGGGFFSDHVVLVSGATGTGKTLLVTSYLAGGVGSGERTLLFAFEESRSQLFRNASGWGFDFASYEENGTLRTVCRYPETLSLEDHLLAIESAIDEYGPDRIAVDSLSALERTSTAKSYREFVLGLTALAKERGVVAMMTSTAPSVFGGNPVTEGNISTITDAIILLRYVEVYGRVHRAITVLKMRGSNHDPQIREFDIDGSGIHIGEPFRGVSGILWGHLTVDRRAEIDQLRELFDD